MEHCGDLRDLPQFFSNTVFIANYSLKPARPGGIPPEFPTRPLCRETMIQVMSAYGLETHRLYCQSAMRTWQILLKKIEYGCYW
jgi:hypothetical protein